MGLSLDERQAYNKALRLGIAPEVYLFAMNSYKLPKVLEKCIEFAGRFEKLQLSFRGGMYGSKGQYFGDKICIIPEPAKHILKMVKDECLRKLGESGLINEFNTITATYVIGSRAYSGVGLGSLNEILVSFKIPRENLKKLAEVMHDKEITSKLLEKPPYIVVTNMEGFAREIIEALRRVEAKILTL